MNFKQTALLQKNKSLGGETVQAHPNSKFHLLRLFLAWLMLLGNPGPWLALAESATLRFALPAFAASLLFSARRAYARTVYGQPPKTVDLTQTRLGADPTDEELSRLRAFDEPFVPASPLRQGSGGQAIAPIAGENADLAQAIQSDLSPEALAKGDEDLSNLHHFTLSHAGSRWILPVELNRGLALYRRGYFSKSLEAFQTAWEAGQGEKTGPAKALADHALSELMRMNSRVGRLDALKEELGWMKGRSPGGIAARQSQDAGRAIWNMEHHPEKAYFCGPYALQRILLFQKSPKAHDPLFTQSQSTPQGVSLDQVYRLSQELGMGMQIAKRNPGAKVILPAVVHWKLGHYASLLEEKNGYIRSQDTTFRSETWISEKALDAEASGYFLVPEGPLPEGWSEVGLDEAATVWGKGNTTTNPPAGPCGSGATSDGGGSCGMPRTNIDLALAAPMLVDTPLWYQPPVGGPMHFMLTYHEMSPDALPYTGFGQSWNFSYQAFIKYDFNGGQASNYVQVARGGGEDPFPAPGGYTTYTVSQVNTASTFTSGPAMGLPSAFTVTRPDGSVEQYGMGIVSANGLVQCLLTQVIDPQGNAVNIQYDGQNRVQSVVDPIGQVSSFSYGVPGYPNLVSRITDPFGRHADFNYDIWGRLSSITDQLGLTSSFTYSYIDPAAATGGSSANLAFFFSDAVVSMSTPYGTTTFDYTGTDDTKNLQQVVITDPAGERQEALFTELVNPSDIHTAYPAGIQPDIFQTDLTLHDRNIFYWDKKAMETAPGDFNAATIYHYLHSATDDLVRALVLESWKKPLDDRIFFAYPGQTDGLHEPSDYTPPLPSEIARFLSDGSTQSYQYAYNVLGKKTASTDPKGRSYSYSYDTNNIDLLSVKDSNGDLLAGASYNGQHEPLSTTDAAGQATHYTYNAAGQVLTMTTPMGELTSYNYDSQGHLTSVIPPQPGAGVTYTYDNVGRVATKADAVEGTMSYHYDNGDRLVQVNYPDGTFEGYLYTKLDLTGFRDRQGRLTQYAYDNDRRMVSMTDPKTQTTQYGWCGCGSMNSVTDPKGNQTSWTYDLEGRVTQKTYADSSHYNYLYDNASGRLLQVTDPNQQTTKYSYDTDDKVLGVNYFNALAPTPNVAFAYNDPQLGRLTSMTDGTGTSSYAYYPFGQVGGGRLESIQQPVPALQSLGGGGGQATANLVYAYDADGRVASRSIDGVAESYGFTNAELTNVTNPLGSFGYTYDPTSARLTQVAYPNGQQTNLTYFGPGNPLGASGSLETIVNKGAGSTAGQTLSSFNYSYNPTGEIKTWQQQLDNNPEDAKSYGMGYDGDSELQAVTMTSGTTGFDNLTANQSVTYGYDAAGNRTVENTPSYTHGFNTNNLNQLTSETDKPISVTGSTSRPAAVTVNGQSVAEDANNNYATTIQPAAGNTTPLTVTEVTPDGAVNTVKNHILNTGPYQYDANGNLTNDGKKSYVWDAQNRLVQVNILNAQPAIVADNIEMTYDGFGRRVSVTEQHGTTALTTKTFVWCGEELCQERDSTGHTVNKQFFALGEIISGNKYFYSKDHLGNIREMTDSNGVVHANYDYDPFGRQVKLSGDLDADFGYTGFYVEKAAGLDLTWFRAYDANKGRWLNRDPMGERVGLNLFAIVLNDPLRWFDRLGLCGNGGGNTPSTGNPGGGPTPVPSSVLNPNYHPNTSSPKSPLNPQIPPSSPFNPIVLPPDFIWQPGATPYLPFPPYTGPGNLAIVPEVWEGVWNNPVGDAFDNFDTALSFSGNKIPGAAGEAEEGFSNWKTIMDLLVCGL